MHSMEGYESHTRQYPLWRSRRGRRLAIDQLPGSRPVLRRQEKGGSKFMKDFVARFVKKSGLLTIAIALAQAAFGQGITGSITGNVTDPSGAFVGGATVTIRQLDTDLKRTVTTSDQGSYAVTQLAPGNYSV